MTQFAPKQSIGGMTSRSLVIAAAVVVVAAVLPLALSSYQVGLATEILIFGILAMSIDILAGFAGRTSLGHGAIFGVSTYVVVYLTAQAGMSPGSRFLPASPLQPSSRPFSACSLCGPPVSIFCC